MANGVNRELTVYLFKLLFVQSSQSEAMSEFWAHLRHQYGMFRLESQTLLSGDSKGTRLEATVFAGQKCVIIVLNLSLIFLYSSFRQDGKFYLQATLPETITTWVLQAVAVSNQTGFGLAPPISIKTFKPFFVSLSLPYSIQRGEQVSVIATVYNYQEVDCKVKFNKRRSEANVHSLR